MKIRLVASGRELNPFWLLMKMKIVIIRDNYIHLIIAI